MNTCIFGADYRIKQMMTEKDTTVYSEYQIPQCIRNITNITQGTIW